LLFRRKGIRRPAGIPPVKEETQTARHITFYVAGRPFDSLRDAAAEVSRISGEDAELWRLRKNLDRNKGFMNGVPVSQKITEQAEEDGDPGEPRKRRPLMRLPARGLPPKWH
jgi:hypothetical protein